MTVTILLFATLKDRAGVDRVTLTLTAAETTLTELKAALSQQYATLTESLNSAVAAINQEFAFGHEAVRDGDEVAFFPPVSGGLPAWPDVFRIASGALDLNELTAAITTPATGAVCLFSGYVRGETNAEGGLIRTVQLEYEAYEPMALAKMQQVAAEIRERWPLVQGIAIVQRIGMLAVGEPTVLIACAGGHRDQGCFEAARYGIDRLKEIVPVWKKEIGVNGEHWVEGSYQPDMTDKSS
jgi:MoaE-MoaD fusion protein